MKIYLASVEEHSIKKTQQIKILLSFYDLTINTIPFRKETFKIIKEMKWKSKNKS